MFNEKFQNLFCICIRKFDYLKTITENNVEEHGICDSCQTFQHSYCNNFNITKFPIWLRKYDAQNQCQTFKHSYCNNFIDPMLVIQSLEDACQTFQIYSFYKLFITKFSDGLTK